MAPIAHDDPPGHTERLLSLRGSRGHPQHPNLMALTRGGERNGHLTRYNLLHPGESLPRSPPRFAVGWGVDRFLSEFDIATCLISTGR